MSITKNTFLLFAIYLFIINAAHGQQLFQIGSGTTVTSGTTASPINIYYRSSHGQIVYTAAELQAQGAAAGTIVKLGFYIESGTTYPLPDFTINMKHTTAVDPSTYDAGPFTEVYNNASYAPSPGGFELLELATPFLWNGSDNILIDVCFAQVPDYTSTGTIRYYNDLGGYSYYRTDGSNSCGIPTNSSTPEKPQILFEMLSTAPNDAGLASAGDDIQVCEENYLVQSNLVNFGIDSLLSVDINWSIDGQLQTPLSLTPQLDTIGSGNNTLLVDLGTIVFNPGDTKVLKAWTSNPNGFLDTLNYNDTIISNLNRPLKNNFTIGGSNPDFSTFTEAIDYLNAFGVCEETTFSIRNGTYTEQINIGKINGTDETHQVNFTSESGDSTDVVLTFSSDFSTNYTLAFSGSEYVNFSKLTIEALSTTYNTAVLVENQSKYLTFENCRFISSVTGGYNLISLRDFSEHLIFKNNHIQGGNFGISYDELFDGGGDYEFSDNKDKVRGDKPSGNQESNTGSDNGFNLNNSFALNDINGIVVEHNLFSQNFGAVSLINQTAPKINDNIINATQYGIQVIDAYEDGEIDGNVINYIDGQSGIYLENIQGSETKPFLVSNNFIHVIGTGTDYGIQGYSNIYLNIFHNTINVENTSTNSGALFLSNTIFSNSQNNILVNTGGGFSYILNNNTLVSNDNNLFSTGANLAIYNGVLISDLSVWQNSSSLDQNSFSVDPLFLSNDNFIITEATINNKGIPVGILTDIEGESRDAVTPDIGADEWSPPPIDAGLVKFNSPGSPITAGPTDIEVIIQNAGVDTLETVIIDWEVNDVLQTPFNWSGNLASGNFDTAVINVVDFTDGQVYDLKAWTTMPNGQLDQFPENDTIVALDLEVGLSGIYTIGGVDPDYQSFTDAVIDLELKGAADTVIFNVRDGSYNEQLSFEQFLRNDPSTPVIFQSESGDSTLVSLTFNASSTANYTVRFNGADNICFQHMSLLAANGTYARVIEIANQSDDIALKNNIIQGVTTTSSSSIRAVIFATSTTLNNNLLLENNLVLNGSYGLFYTANFAHSSGTEIYANSFINQSYYGIYLDEHNAPQIKYNIINSNVGTSNVGIYNNDSNLGGSIVGNQIYGDNLNIGIRLSDFDGDINNRGLVANNFVELSSGSNLSYGLYIISSSSVDVIHNTIQSKNENVGSVASYFSNNVETEILNNIFSNQGGGIAVLLNSSNNGLNSDYNNFFVTGPNLLLWDGLNFQNIEEWQNGAPALDANSISVNPFLVSDNNYAVAQSALNAAAFKSNLVDDDIDKELRDAVSPDIGADEFELALLDSGVSDILSSANPFPIGTQEVFAVLRNHGGDTLKNVNINWTINGAIQSPIFWLGNLASGDTAQISLGNIDFQAGQFYDIASWTSNPNGSADAFAINDTSAVKDLTAALNGVYTIGGISPDFLNFTAAANTLNKGGILGPVTFNVRDGNYIEQFQINEILGSDTLNPILFQSESGDSTSVVISFNATFSENYTMKLNGVDWISFNNLTFEGSNSSYGNVVEITNSSNHVNFNNNIFNSINNTNDFSIYIPSTTLNEYNTFYNNVFLNSGYGVYYVGNFNSGNYTKGVQFVNNKFENIRYYGIWGQYLSEVAIISNNISSSTINSNFRGIYLNASYDGGQIIKNEIISKIRGSGIHVVNVSGDGVNPFLIANNNVIILGDDTYASYGIYSDSGSNQKIYHNSVSCLSSNDNSYAGAFYYGSVKEVYNNIFANFGGGYSYYNLGSGILASDHNNLFSSGINLVYWNNPYTDLPSLQSALGYEINSISIDPAFIDNATDLHSTNVLLNVGIPVPEVVDDIDGQLRDLVMPDIGADEFLNEENDAALILFNTPSSPFDVGTQTISLELLNNGLDTLNDVEINWEVNGAIQAVFNWTGNLLTGESEDSIVLGDFIFELDSVYSILAWSSNPNGQVDQETQNDTISLDSIYPALNGIYTIGGVDPDFINFSKAVNALKVGGVTGPVTFNVRADSYEEQIIIPEITGADSLNQVTFQSESGDSSSVILTFASLASNDNYVLLLDGADWVNFRQISIQATASNYGNVVELRNGATNNVFANNALKSVYGFSNKYLLYVNTNANTGYNSDNLFINNDFRDGTYGILWNGNANEANNQFIANTFSNFYYRAISVGSAKDILIENNFINISTNDYAIFCNNCDGAFNISKNQIIGSFYLGIYLSGCDGSISDRGLVSNNYLQNASTSNSTACFYFSGSDYFDIVYNTARIISNNSSNIVNNIPSGTQINLFNNIFVNEGSGRAIYVSNPSGILASDYNNLFSNGANLAYWNGDQENLLEWQNASGQDANSYSVDPNFIGIDDFHIEQVDLNKAGTPLTYVTDDLDGELRSPLTPDIGADEFMIITTNDAEIVSFISPNGLEPFVEGVQPVYAELKNNGADTLVNVSIMWEANSNPQTDYSWTGVLLPGERDTINLGNHNFVLGFGTSLKAYTQNPNGQLDNNPENDTATIVDLYPALDGVYTVGGVFPDFQNFTAATNSLNNGGVLGPVTFNVRNGDYEETISIDEVKGASASNPIIFQSESLDSSKVKLHYNTTSARNFVIRLNGADYITFSNLTLEETGGSYNTVIELSNGANFNTFSNNRISTTSATSSDELVFSGSSLDQANQFYSNTFSGGGDGIYMLGVNSSNTESGMIIENNVFENQSQIAIYLSYAEAPKIHANRINTNRGNSSYYGVYCNYCLSDFEITSNNINASQGYGLHIRNSSSTVLKQSLIANNFIHVGGGTYISYGILSYYGSYQNYYHNSINLTNTNPNSVAFYNTYGSDKTLLNNVFSNSSAGFAIRIDGTNSVNSSNYNDLYTVGTNVGYWSGATVSNIANWRIASNRDLNSVSEDPLFYSDTDLHALQIALDGGATSLSAITVDIDGEERDPTAPDIGADEFSYLENDLGIVAILSPVDDCNLGNAETVEVLIQNYGGIAQTGFDILFGIRGGLSITENVGSLVILPGQTASFTFSTPIDLSSNLSYPIESYTLLSGDLNVSNDTLNLDITNFNTPTVVSNMLPAEGAVDIDIPIDFSWLPSIGAENYDLYLWKQGDPIPTQPTGKDLNQINYAYTNNNLVFGAVYEWKVVAKNDFCETEGPTQSFTLRELPDLIAKNVLTPSSPFSGQEIELTWEVENQAVGSTSMTGWYDYIYLSADQVFQEGVDTYLGGFVNLTALNFGESYAQTKMVNLPEGIQGTYYIFVIADRNNNLIEGNDDNNISAASPIAITLTPPPDLVVTDIIQPNQAFSGTEINVQWTVLNQGLGDVIPSYFVDRIYISTSPVFNIANAEYLGAEVRESLVAGESEIKSKTLALPANVFGDYYVHIVTDYNNSVYEYVFEDNNISTSSVMDIILTPPPDLVVQNIQLPLEANNRETIQLTWESLNQGGTPSSKSFIDRVYISHHNVFDLDSVTFLGQVFNPDSLNNNGVPFFNSLNVKIPATAASTQYIYVFTDYYNNVFEFNNEGNNISQSASINIKHADLIVSSVSIPDTAFSGSDISIEWTVLNQGVGDVETFSRNDSVYISPSKIFNYANATGLGTIGYSTELDAGQSINRLSTFTVPNGIQGKQYVHVFADAKNVIFEAEQEDNNFGLDSLVINLTPWPDLIISSLTGLPDTTTAGSLLTATFEVLNFGAGAVQGAGSWTDRIYISANPVWNPADAKIITDLDILASIGSGDSYDNTSSFILPMLGNNAGSGVCYIYVFADAEDDVFEYIGEGNNYRRSDPIYVIAPPPVDFTILNATTLPDTVMSGSLHNLQWMVQNEGSSTALWDYQLWYDGIFLCPDSTWQGNYEYFVKDFTKQGPLENLASYSNNQMFKIPDGFSGDYYALLVADHTSATNNVLDSTSVWKIRPQGNISGAVKPIHVVLSPSPDLRVDNMLAPNSEFSGQPIDIIYTVNNDGAGPTSGSWTDKVYLSTDFSIENSDPIIATKSQERIIAPGSSYTDTIQAFIPIDKIGNFVVILKTDANNVLYEFNGENNNVFYSFLTTSLPLPSDLVVENLSFESEAMVGDPFVVNYDLLNQGSNPSTGYMSEIVYLSKDSIFDATDIKHIGPIERNISLAPNTSTGLSPVETTPGVPLGDYFVIVQTDILDNIYESNDLNNITISEEKVTITLKELVLDVVESTSMQNEQGIYYRIEIDEALDKETMLVSLASNTADGINELYLSYGTIPTRSNHDYSFSNAFEANQSIVVPEISPGTYYVLAYGASTSQSFQDVDLKAEIIPFQVLSVDAGRGGNTGNVTLKIEGAKFTPNMTLELTDPVLGTLTAHKLIFMNSTLVFATFNLAGANLGFYDMKATSGAEQSSLVDAFEVVQGGAGTVVGDSDGSFFCNIVNVGTQHYLSKDIQHPSAVRVNRLVPITIIFGNGGNVDIPCPSRWLLSKRGAPLSFDPDNFDEDNQELYLEFQEPNGPPGILRPGSVASITVYSYSSHPLSFILKE